MSQFDATYYEDLRGRVRGVVISTAPLFEAKQVGLLDELIDANEPGVAVEMLIEMLVEARASIDPPVMHEIEKLVADMKLGSEAVQKLMGEHPSGS